MCYLCNKQFLGASPQTSWAGALLLDPAGGTAPDLLFPPMSATFSTDLGCLDKSLANQLYTDIVIKIQNNHDKIHKSIPKLTIKRTAKLALVKKLVCMETFVIVQQNDRNISVIKCEHFPYHRNRDRSWLVWTTSLNIVCRMCKLPHTLTAVTGDFRFLCSLD